MKLKTVEELMFAFVTNLKNVLPKSNAKDDQVSTSRDLVALRYFN